MAENTSMDIHEILNHLPHRYPFVLIDKVISMELGKEIFAIKNVSSHGSSCCDIVFQDNEYKTFR